MNPLLILPISIGIFWMVHATLHLLGRKESRYTFWLLIIGLLVATGVFFLMAYTAEPPVASRWVLGHVNDGGFVAILLFLECLALWFILGLLELILRSISPQIRPPVGTARDWRCASSLGDTGSSDNV